VISRRRNFSALIVMLATMEMRRTFVHRRTAAALVPRPLIVIQARHCLFLAMQEHLACPLAALLATLLATSLVLHVLLVIIATLRKMSTRTSLCAILDDAAMWVKPMPIALRLALLGTTAPSAMAVHVLMHLC